MSISNRQISRIEQKIIDKILRSGRLPILKEVQEAVLTYFKNKAVGLPRFTPVFVSKREVSDPDSYNKMIDEIYEDLETAFEEMSYQENRLYAAMENYQIEMSKIENAIKTTASRIDSIVTRIKEKYTRGITVEDSFSDFLKVEFTKDIPRQIYGTSCFVDLKNGTVRLEEDWEEKIDLSTAEAKVSVKGDYLDAVTVSHIANCLNDSINEAWQYTVIKEKPETTTVTIAIDLREETEISYVTITNLSPHIIKASLRIGRKAGDLTGVGEVESLDVIKWSFAVTPCRYLEIDISKDEPDNTWAGSYEYHFGLLNISVGRKTYRDKGVLVSKRYNINRYIDTVTLKAESITPPGTEIKYYVALDDDANPLQWREIKDGGKVSFGCYITETVEPDPDITTDFGLRLYKIKGVDFYSIGKLDYQPVGGVTVYEGFGQWLMEKKTVSVDDASKIATAEDLTRYSWFYTGNDTTGYISTDKTGIAVEKNQLVRLTLWLYCTEAKELLNCRSDTTGNVFVKVYVNNKEIPAINGTRNFRFNKGWNRVQFFAFGKDSSTISPHFDWFTITEFAYGNRIPLQQVKLFTLQHNTSPYDNSKFAIDGMHLVINRNPLQPHIGEPIRYIVRYNRLSDTARKTGLRFMAILKRDENIPTATPMLEKYVLTIL